MGAQQCCDSPAREHEVSAGMTRQAIIIFVRAFRNAQTRQLLAWLCSKEINKKMSVAPE